MKSVRSSIRAKVLSIIYNVVVSNNIGVDPLTQKLYVYVAADGLRDGIHGESLRPAYLHFHLHRAGNTAGTGSLHWLKTWQTGC